MIQWMVSSSVLILVVIALRYALRGRISLRMQYALWLLVLVRLLVPMSFGASGWSVANALPEAAPSVRESTLLPERYGKDKSFTATAPGTPAQNFSEPFSPELVQPADPAGTGNGGVPTAESTPQPMTDWARIGAAVWLVGAAALGLVFLAVNLRFGRRLRRTRESVTTDARLPVYESGATDTPCLFGVVKPSIYVTPDTLTDAEALRYSLAHEQTHYRHGDNVWAVLRGVCLALHWYNPLVWWAAELSRRDAELACDEATIRRIGESERAAYGRTLIRMTCEKRPALLVTATMMTDSGEGLHERISLLVKKPKTAAYTAAAVLLVACLSVACTFTGGRENAELAEPFGKSYEVAEVVYQPSVYSFALTTDTAPWFRIAANGESLTVVALDNDGASAENAYGALEVYTLTKENFDERFLDDQLGWEGGGSQAAKLRRENAKAWHCTAAEDPSWPEEIYLLQQKDGSLYLVMGYDWESSEKFPDGMRSFRWLFRLSERPVPTYESVEAYVLSIIDALKQPDGYTYSILPEESSTDGMPVEVTEAAADVRVTDLSMLGDCKNIGPEGVLELWSFSYEVKPEDQAGALPDRFLWVGGNNITDDGYISDGWMYYLTMLRTSEGAYQLLGSRMANDGLFYNGMSYDSAYEYLYDFWADRQNYDWPRYLVRGFFTGLVSDPTILATSEDAVGHRYDGEGWLLYTPTIRWYRTTNPGEDCWYSGYQTGSTLRVDKSMDSVKAMESFYREGGFTLEQFGTGEALSGPWKRFDAESGTQFANYLMPNAEEGGCYIISTYWKPTDEVVTNQWGEWNKGVQVQNEAIELEQMARSFVVMGKAQYFPTFETDLALAASGSGSLMLTSGGAEQGSYSLGDTWNKPQLADYEYTPGSAPQADGGAVLTLWLSNNDASYFTFYEGTNTVGYFLGGSDTAEYYEAHGYFENVDGDGRRLFDRMLDWYDEAEFAALRGTVEDAAIPNGGLTWQQAAQEWIDAYEGAHLGVRSGSMFRYTWVKNTVRLAEEETKSLRERGELDENSYAFYTTTAFVPENEQALNNSMAGNTGNCEDPDAPEGAYEYYRCCAVRLEEDGWHGVMYGTGW